MPSDIALHPMGNPLSGNHPPAPPLPLLGGQTSLAENTNSGDIVVPLTGGVLVIQSSVKVRMDIVKRGDDGSTFPALAPATSPIVLMPDAPRLFSLPGGTYRLKTLVYA